MPSLHTVFKYGKNASFTYEILGPKCYSTNMYKDQTNKFLSSPGSKKTKKAREKSLWHQRANIQSVCIADFIQIYDIYNHQ